MGKKAFLNFSHDRNDHAAPWSSHQTPGVLLSVIAVSAITLSGVFIANAQSDKNLQNAQKQSSLSQQKSIRLHANTNADASIKAPLQATENILTDTTVKTTGNSETGQLDVSINGRNLEVPADGIIRERITTDAGQTDVTVTQDQPGSGSSSNSSSTSITVSGSSSSSADIESETETDIRIRQRGD